MNEPVMPTGLPYHRLHEAGLPGWWRPVLGSFIVMAVLAFGDWPKGEGKPSAPQAVRP